MSNYTRIQVIQRFYSSVLVPLFYHPDAKVVVRMMQGCYNGGARLFEFTNRGDFAHEIFAEISKFANKSLPGMIVGAGSVEDSATASLYMQLGANFIVSPFLKEDIALVCNRRKVLWIPGCGTVSEISRAEELGAEIVKLFPGSPATGIDFVKSIKGPMPWTCLMPSGGIEPTEEIITSWLSAGAACIGMGSHLINHTCIESGDDSILIQKVSHVISIIENFHSKN
jgi:2-dehydro-3-deoxyphosphogluconate aldolase / (4S)-4-hydroxy-2-oxoglutarate aldolase